jgi:hypothetical protein
MASLHSLIQTLTNEVAILNANVQEEREARDEDRRERDDLKNQLSNLYTDLIELQDKVDSRDNGTISSPTRSPPPKKKKTDDVSVDGAGMEEEAEGVVDLIDNSYFSTLLSLWQLPTIARQKLCGHGKWFVQNLRP